MGFDKGFNLRKADDRVYVGAMSKPVWTGNTVRTREVEPVYAAVHWDAETAAWVCLTYDVSRDYAIAYSRHCKRSQCVDRTGRGAAVLVCVLGVWSSFAGKGLTCVVLDVVVPALPIDSPVSAGELNGMGAIVSAVELVTGTHVIE